MRRIKRNQNSGLKELRERMGITQKQLAEYLSVSRSIISMAEGHNRALPEEASSKFHALYLQVAANGLDIASPAPLNDWHVRQGLERKKVIDERILECRCQLGLLNKELANTRKQYDKLVKAVRVLPVVPRGISAEGKKDELWQNIYSNQFIKDLDRYGLDRQASLELRIAAYSAELDRALTMNQ